MTVPTPLNDHERDDRFDRGLERLLAGDRAGIDDIEPGLRDISSTMVGLAEDAGWIVSDPGKPAVTSRFRNAKTVINALAAVITIGVIGGMVMLGIQVWGPGDDQYGSGVDEPMSVQTGPGICRRVPRPDAEISEIVNKTESEVEPFDGPGVLTDVTNASMQLTRDWNACLQSGQ